MGQIAVDSLARCRSLQDIAAVANTLDWLPTPAPKEVGPLLPVFLELSQAVRAALASTSVYRQWESLGPPLSQLERLKKELTQQEPHLAISYGGIVESWLGMIRVARANLETQALHSNEIPAVYVAGAALDPETAGDRFRGRQDLFREIETLALAAEPPTLLLYGGRRTGKTSALKYLPRRVGPDLVPLLVDVQGLGMTLTLQGTAQFLVQEIQRAARQARNLTLPTLAVDDLQVEPIAALQQWFTAIAQAHRGKRFLLCLDEFERLSEVVNATGSRAPLNFLRYVIQHQRQWIVLFSGAHTPRELDSYWSDYLINSQCLRLSYLDEADARDLIQRPIPQFPDIYEPAAVDAIVHLTRCQPYLVQLTCLVLVEWLNRKAARDRRATAADVETIVPKVIERGGEVLRERFHTLSPQEQTLLGQLATQAPLSPNSQILLQRLVQQEIMEPSDHAYRFQVPLFERYVQGVQTGQF